MTRTMFTLVFAFDSSEEKDITEGLEAYMNQDALRIEHGFHVTTVEFDMSANELAGHRLGKMISRTFPEIDYYIKQE